MDKIKVSVIIPCFNQGIYIHEAINSILAQTYTNYEIIIINDGSTDEETNLILSNIKHPLINVFSIENKGLPGARNYGIRKSKGEYILTLDADDMFEKTFLEKATSILNNDENIVIVGAYNLYFGTRNGIYDKFKSGGIERFLIDPGVSACALFRKNAWQQVGGYNESMIDGMEDWDFWLRIVKNGLFLHIIEEPLFKYRLKEGSMSVQSNNMRIEIVKKIFTNHKDIYQKYWLEVLIQEEERFISFRKAFQNLSYDVNYWKSAFYQMKNSNSFKLGYLILHPIKFFKKIIKK